MKATDIARIVLYRCHEKGVEVLLIRPDLKDDETIWRLPTTAMEGLDLNNGIRLEDDIEGGVTMAVEADWHQIPSIRGIIKHDAIRLGTKIKQVSNLSQFKYHSVKDALQRVMPQEYQALKELKDILLDKNQASFI